MTHFAADHLSGLGPGRGQRVHLLSDLPRLGQVFGVRGGGLRLGAERGLPAPARCCFPQREPDRVRIVVALVAQDGEIVLSTSVESSLHRASHESTVPRNVLHVNLFVVAVGGGSPAPALRALAERLPFFPGRPVETWHAHGFSAAWVQHEGIDYVRTEPSFELLAGHPAGRFVRIRWDGSLHLSSDALGAYPVFETTAGGVRYVSNNAELLRALRGTTDVSLESVAGLLGGGWPLDGDPMWEGVRRLNTPAPHAVEGGGFDAERAAGILVDEVRTLADWPGRPSIVPVTGGRDSRLVLAAALAAGIDFETRTGGERGHPDVEIGRRLAEVAGVPWSTLEHDPHGSVASDWRRAAELLHLTTAGTASLSDAAGFPFGPRPGPLPLWHSGQGGEIARAYYGAGAGLDRDGLVERLYSRFTGRRPGRAEILGDAGREIVRDQIAGFVDDALAAGIEPIDVPDHFYLWRRMGTWAGPTHGAVEYVRDTTSPLWSERLLPDLLGLAAADREREEFHRRVLERLAPQLAQVPYEGSVTFAGKVRRELRRRLRPPRDDAFATTLSEIRELVNAQPEHPAWQMLDRTRVEQLLASTPGALDTMSRYYAWRLATVFAAPT
jgi:hypothetical protein